MTSRTHIATSTAITMAIINPSSLSYLTIALSTAVLGSTIPDIDIITSDSREYLTKILFILTISIITCLGLEIYFDLGLIELIKKKTEITYILVGLTLFLVTCFYGIHKPHRTFMHSLICLLILTYLVSIIFKISTLPFFIGMLSHIVLDLLNHKKIQLFYPFKKRVGLNLCDADGIVNNITFAIFSITFIIELIIFIYFK